MIKFIFCFPILGLKKSITKEVPPVFTEESGSVASACMRGLPMERVVVAIGGGSVRTDRAPRLVTLPPREVRMPCEGVGES